MRIQNEEDLKRLINEVEALFNDRHNIENIRTPKTEELQLAFLDDM